MSSISPNPLITNRIAWLKDTWFVNLNQLMLKETKRLLRPLPTVALVSVSPLFKAPACLFSPLCIVPSTSLIQSAQTQFSSHAPSFPACNTPVCNTPPTVASITNNLTVFPCLLSLSTSSSSPFPTFLFFPLILHSPSLHYPPPLTDPFPTDRLTIPALDQPNRLQTQPPTPRLHCQHQWTTSQSTHR